MAQVQEELGPVQLTRRLLVWEIVIVFALSLGGSALFADHRPDRVADGQQGPRQAAGPDRRLSRAGPPVAGPRPATGQPADRARSRRARLLPAGPGGHDPVRRDRPRRPGARPRPGQGRHPGRGHRRLRPRPLHRRVQARAGPQRGPGEPARRLVAHPGADPAGRPGWPPRRGPGHRLPAPPPGPAGHVTGQGDRGERRGARLLPPLPGLRRFPRQRRDGRDLRAALPPVEAGHPADHRAHPDRHRRVRRLRRPARPRVLAPLPQPGDGPPPGVPSASIAPPASLACHPISAGS